MVLVAIEALVISLPSCTQYSCGILKTAKAHRLFNKPICHGVTTYYYQHNYAQCVIRSRQRL